MSILTWKFDGEFVATTGRTIPELGRVRYRRSQNQCRKGSACDARSDLHSKGQGSLPHPFTGAERHSSLSQPSTATPTTFFNVAKIAASGRRGLRAGRRLRSLAAPRLQPARWHPDPRLVLPPGGYRESDRSCQRPGRHPRCPLLGPELHPSQRHPW